MYYSIFQKSNLARRQRRIKFFNLDVTSRTRKVM